MFFVQVVYKFVCTYVKNVIVTLGTNLFAQNLNVIETDTKITILMKVIMKLSYFLTRH